MRSKPALKKTGTPVKKIPAAPTFKVVAIGASAGGLEAMTELLKSLPPDTGMAFIYVQHLSPDHKSMLTQILSKTTSMKVQEIDNMDKIKPDNVFVIPYNKGIEVTDGHIKLIPRSGAGVAISIDVLFTSLAQAQKERVIGIILSGSASDGSQGIRDIKHEGGLTFAQDNSAKFISMPQSAINTGAVDFILSPKEIALELGRLSKHPFVKDSSLRKGQESSIDNNDPDLKIILQHIYQSTGVDFSAYKMNTIKRRIIRRIILYKIKSLKEYAKLIAQKNEEIEILYQDLLINITRFFRDTDTHKYLQSTLFPKLLKSKKANETLRIWVPACSTGEEAFSLAIMLTEIQEMAQTEIPVQIFATDLSVPAVGKARSGLYTKLDLEAVSPQRIQRFFTKYEDGFRIGKAISNMCVFARHDILQDPPFSRLDFISCCNLFIYLDSPAQKSAINTFHFALNSGGYLMLGKSENISASEYLFTVVNKKFKIFSRKNNTGTHSLPALTGQFARSREPRVQIFPGNNMGGTQAKSTSPLRVSTLDRAIDEIFLTRYMPASVVINHDMEILLFKGATEAYLAHPQGKATLNILKMARPEIAFEIRNAISKAIKSKTRIQKGSIEIKTGTDCRYIGLEVVPLTLAGEEPLLLILFTDQEMVEIFPDHLKGAKSVTPAKDRRIKRLEEELATAYADALAFSEEQQAFAEELQSSNEEVVSSNEELQTLNEELETSKEEIESTNEELTTTNQELQTRNDLLEEAYDYADAIVTTMHEPMIILDKELRVKTANKSFYKKFDVKEIETVGQLIYDLGNKQWDIPKLRKLLTEIIVRNTPFLNYEVKHHFPEIGEKIMLLNARRVVQKTKHEQLVLLSISDITEVRKLALAVKQKETELFRKNIEQQKIAGELLEETVRQRTRDLIKANIELEKMNKELESFTYVSSHDLQEPLRKIQTFAGRILEKENLQLSDKGKNYFRLLCNSVERMQTLIQDLLAFSRINTMDRKFELTDLNEVMREVRKEHQEAITARNATLTVKFDCKICVIPFQFLQLMNNLISNALKFSNPAVPPRIVVTARKVKYNKAKMPGLSPDREYCHISFADNGIGFEKEYSKKIFEVFQRLHAREEFAGTGIGLAIVKKIIDNHNGLITAVSRVKKGTIFDIYVPVDQSPQIPTNTKKNKKI